MERLTNKKHQININAGLSPSYWLKPVAEKLGELEDILEKHEISSVEELDRELEKIEALRLVVKNLQDSNFLKRQELDKYHNIEEELGIDLITLFNVLKAKKVYHKKYGYYDNCSVDVNRAEIWFDNENVKKGKPLHYENLKDYGKTWALTKGELK